MPGWRGPERALVPVTLLIHSHQQPLPAPFAPHAAHVPELHGYQATSRTRQDHELGPQLAAFWRFEINLAGWKARDPELLCPEVNDVIAAVQAHTR